MPGQAHRRLLGRSRWRCCWWKAATPKDLDLLRSHSSVVGELSWSVPDAILSDKLNLDGSRRIQKSGASEGPSSASAGLVTQDRDTNMGSLLRKRYDSMRGRGV